MKKFAFVFVLFIIVMGGMEVFAQDRYTVDLNTLPAKRNATAFTRAWDYFVINFPAFPANINWSNFNRVIVRARYFNADGSEIRQQDSKVQVTLVYDPNGDLFGPENGPGPNTPLKAQNLGGSGSVHRDNGAAVRLNAAPGAIVFQNNTPDVAFVEVDEITFFRR